jgi:hypothetical protein
MSVSVTKKKGFKNEHLEVFRTSFREPKAKTEEIKCSRFFCKSVSSEEKSFITLRTRYFKTQ